MKNEIKPLINDKTFYSSLLENVTSDLINLISEDDKKYFISTKLDDMLILFTLVFSNNRDYYTQSMQYRILYCYKTMIEYNTLIDRLNKEITKYLY